MKISLAAMRVNRKVKQKDIAKALGVHPSTVRNWERGNSYPTAEQFKRVCEILDCSMDDIFLPTKSA